LNHNSFNKIIKWADENKIDDLQFTDYNNECNDKKFRGLPRNKKILLKIKNLNLSEYNLYNIPEEIGDFKNLVCLNLDFNNLTLLPYNLCNLENLETLSISENKLTKIEEDFSFLPNLYRINIVGNDLKKIPNKLVPFIVNTMN